MSCYTGSLFESEILAECTCVWDNDKSYKPYMVCVELVKKNQPKHWDPSSPTSRAANDLHALVVEALKLQDYDCVKLYTALHSPLDRWHGVDCFIEYNGKIVTIDLTVNPHKTDYKANVVLHEADVYNSEGRVNKKRLRYKAQTIAELLLREA